MNTNFSQHSSLTVILYATVLSVLSFCAIPPLPCRADYTYGGTELSWEWLTDASRAIVIGSVTSVEDDGFVLEIADVLKRRGLTVEVGQLVQGPLLGRAQLYDRGALHWQMGWPTLSNAATYPVAGAAYDCPWQPRLIRQETWTQGDQCLIFYGQDLQSPLQIINLDKPVTVEIEFLAVDLAGQPVTRPERLIERIQERVATTQDDFRRPRVRPAGINYWPRSSSVDGHSYHLVLAPPEKALAALWKPEILVPPTNLATQIVQIPTGEDLGEASMAPQSVWYWFFSGKSGKDFALDAQEERNAAVRELLLSERGEQDIRRQVSHHGVIDYFRYKIYRRHRTNYRTYPLGWLCVRSYDQQYAAFVDGAILHVSSIDAASKAIDRTVFMSRDAHRARTYVEFSRDSQFLAYTTAENAVSLVDLEEGKILWTARPSTPFIKPAHDYGATVCLEFSGDQRYLAQQTQLRGPRGVERPNMSGRDSGAQAVHVWDATTGELIFTPYSTWQKRLKYVGFHPRDSSLVRLRRSEGTITDEIWNVRTSKLVRTVDENAAWDED